MSNTRFIVVTPRNSYPNSVSGRPATHAIDKSISGKTLCGRDAGNWNVNGYTGDIKYVNCKVCLSKMFQNETTP